MSWIDITDQLTEKGQEELKVGQILLFTKVKLKIVRKRNGKVWAKRVRLYHPDQVGIVDAVR